MPSERTHALLAWFDAHRRDLPWRRTRDPYAIWVSEIMLQQTRVAAVLEHYARWMECLPTVQALAAAQEEQVLALWSGLGYYRRARMLHRAAQVVVAERGGALPRTAAELRALPGIGAYTAAAIASIAFGEAIAVVDGNVERIVTRLQGLASAPGKQASLGRAIREGAEKLLDPARPGDANQAMMELGATVCLPRAPLCLHCPVQPWCRTRGEHPTPARRPPVARAIAYALIEQEGRVLLRQRPPDASLMAGMWELPELDSAAAGDEPALQLKHAITVSLYTVRIYRRPAPAYLETAARWFAPQELASLALTGLARKVLLRLGSIAAAAGTISSGGRPATAAQGRREPG